MRIKKVNQTTPTNAQIIDSLESESTTDGLSAKKGKELKTLIDSMDKIIVSSTEPTGNDRKKIWLQNGISYRIIDSSNLKLGDISTETGKEVSYDGFVITSNLIEVEANTKYIASYEANSSDIQIVIYEYDSSKAYIGYNFDTVLKFNFTTKTNTKYIKIRFMNFNANAKLENNIRNIYIKNENDVYEEFI